MRRGARPAPLAPALLAVHAGGCSEQSLDGLAEALLSHCGFSGVQISLAAGEQARTGRAGSRGALRALAGRPLEPADDGTGPSRLVRDGAGQPVGRLDWTLGSDAGSLEPQLLSDLDGVLEQLGVAAEQFALRLRLLHERERLLVEQGGRRQAERALRMVLGESAIGMATVSLSQSDPGRFQSVNDALCHLTGRSAEQLLELTSAELTHPDDRAIGNSALRRAMAGRRTPVRSQRRLRHADGSLVWVQVTACPLFDDEDQPVCAILQIEDLSARQGAEVELAAAHDPLTGLLNGSALDQAMVQVLDRARRLDTTGAVLVCEFDAAATAPEQEQQVRRAVASTLGRTLRTGDLIARISDNRFAIVAEEVRPEHAGSLARRVVEAMQDYSEHGAPVDIGVAVLTPQTTDPQVLFEQAGTAMLQARESGQSFVLYQQPEAELYPSEVLYVRPGWQAGVRS